MLASSQSELPRGPEWLYEFKWDGIRALADIGAGSVRLHTRNENDVTVAYPELQVLGTDLDDALLDGEIVAFADGLPSFQSLQLRMHVRSATQVAELSASNPVAFIAFDLLRGYGVDLRDRPLSERRDTLQRLADAHPSVQQRWSVSPAFDDADAVESAARSHRLEGVMAKRRGGRYLEGVRTTDWVKVKFLNRSEFVVIGWEAARDSASTLSSLVLGYYSDGQLQLAGKVGSGLTAAAARALKSALIPTDTPALAGLPPSPGRVLTWVLPQTVVEISYSQWSHASTEARLRHPVFVGVRTDKEPSEIGRDE